MGFLLRVTNQVNVLKDPAMLKGLNDIDALLEEDKKYILHALDGLLWDAKTRAAYK
ncbi:hypothetical protein [Chitinophaga sp. HK235]|uniref:hypothetical protein n=1 Tax=Chitinophaga sp. HK235 TaxID=2952571 RepID=UPI001BAA9910|nr:hypothetical protein [Chitinophaga sp. HK235]